VRGDGEASVHVPDGGRWSQRRVRWLALSAVLVLLLAAAWAVTEPRALREDSGLTVTAPVPVGGSMFVGLYELGDRDVVLQRVEPVVLGGLQATIWLCRPVPGGEVIGTLSHGEIGDHCDLAPVTRGTLLPGATDPGNRSVTDYLIVQLVPTVEQPQAFCGLDVVYRDGWRSARQRQAARYQAVTNPPEHGPGDPLRPLEDCPHQRTD
jgi:hypothetical protein